ncbi:hypothetical protein [Kitasatospora sp. HPMI-4]|uniref:hypothetical protein n=1 Tax=Kitasatospora sp. HPMI-4 TaxID=3448443 RepID=UPI003F1C665E
MRTLKRLASAAAAVSLTAGLGLFAVGTAHAATPDSCGIINIGNPGKVSAYGEYAGEVEQQYNTCNGYAWAHFQWSGQFQADHSGAVITVGIYAQNGGINWGPDNSTAVKDVDSPADYIHDFTPDTFQALAIIEHCAEGAGSWHAYANGANWGDYPGSC